MRFFVGLHHPCDAAMFNSCFISVNVLRNRKRDFKPMRYWILDSGAFTLLNKYGKYPNPPEEYAAQIVRWKRCGTLLAAITQDYMCEPFVLSKTGLTTEEHQRLTIERYDALVRCATGCYIMPVLQGYAPSEYVNHIRMYGERLSGGMWVGVGSVCKRNASPGSIWDVLALIHNERPDLRLHGFGLKSTSLSWPSVRRELWSADSMAWSFAARREGRNPNDPKEAEAFRIKVTFPHVDA